jgi:hypothetical protein
VADQRKKPTKRRIESDADHAPSSTSSRSSRRVTPKESTRYTPPVPNKHDLPSPPWVSVVLFTLLGLGMLVIFLNYVSLLPSAPSNWYLLLGLGGILGGIITATQLR